MIEINSQYERINFFILRKNYNSVKKKLEKIIKQYGE